MTLAAAAANPATETRHAGRRRFRVAVFSYGLPCPGEKRGGIEQVAHDLANALVDRGHVVTVFTYDPRPSTARYHTASLPGRSFATSWLGRRMSMGYLGNIVALGARYGDCDVILSHGDSLLLPLRRKPVIRIMHGTAIEEAMSATSFGRAVLQTGVYVQELLSALMQRGTVGISQNTQRFNPFVRRIIPDGIDLRLFRPDPLARSTVPSLLFVGALTGRKRGAWLLEQFEHRVLPVYPKAELHMVTTSGPAMPGVTYHTGVTADRLAELYRRAWIYVSSSTYEGFGLPYVEALASATPVVATPNAGSREILADGTFGRLVEDNAFASTVCELLGDPDARADLGRAGLARAADFDIARSAERYEALIEEMIGFKCPTSH